jgi:membrane protease YdiL (CAAX protease family)
MIRAGDLLMILLGAFILASLPALFLESTAVTGWILSGLLLMTPLIILQWKRRPDTRQLYPFCSPRNLSWRQLLLFGVSALLALDLVDFLITQLLPPSTQLTGDINELLLFGTTLRGMGVMLAVLVLAPLGEELLFRGFVYRYLLENRGVTEAVLISSLLFALFHPGVYALQILLFGFLLALLRWRTASLLPPLLLHLLNNSWSLLDVNLPGVFPERGAAPWWIMVTVGTLLCCWLFYQFFVREDADEQVQ